MSRHRIAVGLDASEPARRALRWAVGEATRTGAGVLVVTAWPAADRAAAERADGLFAARLRLHHMQSDRIAEATAGLDRPPLIAREIVLADPVTALCHAARFAGIIVIGSRSRFGPAPDSVAVSVARRLGWSRVPVGCRTSPTALAGGRKNAGPVRKLIPYRPGNTPRHHAARPDRVCRTTTGIHIRRQWACLRDGGMKFLFQVTGPAE